MNILVFKSDEEFNRAAAGMMIGLLHTKPDAVLGLATGSTPIGIYGQLADACRRETISFRQAASFNLDEYIGVPEDHPQSYHAYMKRHLFDRVDLPEAQRHIPRGMAVDPSAECERYEKLLHTAKQIDLQLLGLGHNGHIGFNEPGDELYSGTHVVKLDDHTRQANARFFAGVDEVPTHAITMGVGTILRAKTVLLAVRGEDKADIIHRALTGPITTRCPASLLQAHPHLVVMLDEGAARHFGN